MKFLAIFLVVLVIYVVIIAIMCVFAMRFFGKIKRMEKYAFAHKTNPLTEQEEGERAMLQRFKTNNVRWFSQEEFDRLLELEQKAFEGEITKQL